MANYVELITRVMDDFDSIFRKLVDKGVKLGTKTLTESMMTDGSVPTNLYAGLVDTLVRIDGLEDAGLDTINKISSGSATTYTLVAADTGKYNLTLSNLTSAGYYDASSSISAVIAVEDLEISNFKDPADGVYYVTPSSNKLISSVTLPQGSVTVSIDSDNVNNGLGLTLDTTSSFNANNLQIQMDTHNFGANNAYSFTFTPKVTKSGKLSVNPTVETTAGLIKDGDVSSTGLEFNFSGSDSFEPISFYIKQGSIELDEDLLTDGGTASIRASSDLTFIPENTDGTAPANTYELEPVVDDITLNGSFVEGYVKSGQEINLGAISIGGQKKYLKKGSVTAYSNTNVSMYSTLGGLSNITETEPSTADKSNYHTLTVGIGATSTSQGITDTGTVDAGYIKDTTYNVSLQGSKNIYIKKGSYSTTASLTTTASGTGITLSDTEISGGYRITVNPTLTIGTGTVDAGYINNTNQITINTPATTSKDFWVNQGVVNVQQAVSTKFHENTTDGLGEEVKDGTPVDIFLTTPPEERDYYTINPIVSASVTTTGYISGGSSITGILTPDATTDQIQNVTKYLPKADLKWQVSEDGQESYLEVLEGGYLPSGLISVIDADSTPNMATVNLAIGEGSSSIFSNTEIGGGYKLSVSKGAVRAGYISASEGTLQSNEFFIKAGSLGVTAAAGTYTDTAATPTPITEEGETTSYQIKVQGTVTSTIDFSEGYIETSNFKLNDKDYATDNKTISTAVEHTIELNKATIGTADGSAKISLDVDSSSIETVEKEDEENPSKYFVTPTLSGSSTITVETKTAGYLSTSDSTEIEILSDQNTIGATPIFIKTGTGGNITVEADNAKNIVATPNFDETNASGKYEVSVAGTIAPSVELVTGYYGAAEKTISNSVEIVGTTLEIAKGTATANISVETAVTSTDVIFIDDNASVTTGTYVTITAEAPTIENTVEITEGYIKTGEGVSATAKNDKLSVTSGSKKIAKVTKYEETIGGDDGTVTSTEENPSITLDTANKYATGNIVVTLTDHAMGKGVATQLLNLENRLAGRGRTIATT